MALDDSQIMNFAWTWTWNLKNEFESTWNFIVKLSNKLYQMTSNKVTVEKLVVTSYD